MSVSEKRPRTFVFPGRLQVVDLGVDSGLVKKTLRILGALDPYLQPTVRGPDVLFAEAKPEAVPSKPSLAVLPVDSSWEPSERFRELEKPGFKPNPFVFLVSGRLTGTFGRILAAYPSWGVYSLSASPEILALSFEAVLKKTEECQRTRKDLFNSIAEKRNLVHELHHRVKNNFQLITSMLNLKTEGIEHVPTIERLADFRNYLSTMALIHEKLYQSASFPCIDLSELLNCLVDDLVTGFAPDLTNLEIRFDLKPMHLNLDTAVPTAIIVNELVTNVFKHAFPRERPEKGLLRVASGGTVNFAEVLVSDNGVGFPKKISFQDSKTLGFTILRELVRQIGGSLHHRSTKAGTCFVLTIPMN